MRPLNRGERDPGEVFLAELLWKKCFHPLRSWQMVAFLGFFPRDSCWDKESPFEARLLENPRPVRQLHSSWSWKEWGRRGEVPISLILDAWPFCCRAGQAFTDLEFLKEVGFGRTLLLWISARNGVHRLRGHTCSSCLLERSPPAPSICIAPDGHVSGPP